MSTDNSRDFIGAWEQAFKSFGGKAYTDSERSEMIMDALIGLRDNEPGSLARAAILACPTSGDTYLSIKEGDHVGVCPRNPKTASLAFDKVWVPFWTLEITNVESDERGFVRSISVRPTRQEVPSFVRCWHGSLEEARASGLLLFSQLQVLVAAGSPSGDPDGIMDVRQQVERKMAEILSESLGARATPVYCTRERRKLQFQEGNKTDVLEVLSRLPVAIEDALDWDQIKEFREDSDSKRRYRAFVHWLDKDLAGRSFDFIEDEIALRLDAYKEALRKHGIRTKLGFLETLLARTGVAAGVGAITASVAAGMAGEALLAALCAAGALILGEASIIVTKRSLERRELASDNLEISFVHEVIESVD